MLGAFPAHAGMNQPLPLSAWPSGCVPRACGDEPELRVVQGFGDERSPRMRG